MLPVAIDDEIIESMLSSSLPKLIQSAKIGLGRDMWLLNGDPEIWELDIGKLSVAAHKPLILFDLPALCYLLFAYAVRAGLLSPSSLPLYYQQGLKVNLITNGGANGEHRL
jgi:hypothetical protein